MVMNLIEQETSQAIQYRISFSERKTRWINFRVERRKEKFLAFLNSEEIQKPAIVEKALEDVRERQAEFVEKRKILVNKMATFEPDGNYTFKVG